MSIQGIDISNNQGAITWGQVAAAGIQFAFVKATEGATFPDAFFPTNMTGAAAAGIAPAAYHFALPALNAPETEARWFLNYAAPFILPGYPVALDMEEDPYGNATPADCGPWAVRWMQVVGDALGCVPLLYTNLDMIQNHGLGIPALANSGLWLASPGSVQPPTPAPWAFTAVWQRTWQGRVPGIAGNVDRDVFMGDVAAFRRYGRVAPPPKPVPTNDDLEQLHRLVDAEPFDADALVTYAGKFA